MKKLLIASAIVAASFMPSLAETITVGSTNYTVTRNEKQLAKGVKYTELLFPGRTYTGYTGGGRVHVIEADVTDPTVKIEVINNGSLSGTKTLANHAKSVSKDGYKVVAGANANFWITSEQPWKSQTPGWPHGVVIRNGSMFTDPNVKTDPHCGGPAVTGMVAVDEDGKVYIDRTKAQLTWNAPGSGVAFQAVHVATGHQLDLDMCNRYVKAGTASIYNKNYGTSTAFKPVNLSSSNTWEIVTGVCTELLLDLAPGESWNVGGITKFIIKEKRENAGTGTLGNHDLAIVGRDSYANVMSAGYNVGDEVNLSTVINFESMGTPKKIAQAISGNILAMKDGVKDATLTTESYNKNANERTLYATNADGSKLWILVCEHNVAQSKKYFGWSTSQMCDIAKSFGATNATQVDCGGSAQMYAGTSQVSQSYDSSGIRGVYNGLFVISTDTSTPEPEAPLTSVDLNIAYSDVEIAQLAGKTIKRAIAKGNYVYILAHDANNAPTVVVYDHANKSVLRTLGVSNCVGSHTSLSDIALTEDNYLVGCARDVAAFGSESILFYKWNNDASGVATGEAIQWNVTNQGGNWNTSDSGETMAYSGTTTNGYIYYTSKSNTANSVRFARVTVNSKGQLESPLYNKQITDLDYTVISAPRIYASPFDNNKFIINGTNSDIHEINFVATKAGQATKAATMSLFAKSAAHTDIFKYGNYTYMVAPTATGVALAHISDGLSSASLVTLNSSAIASSSTSNIAAVGVEVPAATRATSDNELALMVIRDGKISKFSTKKDETTEPPVPTPTYNGERAVFAYNLDRTGDDNLKEYYINYTLSDEAEEVTINLINKADNSVTSIAGGNAKGENKVTVPMSELEPKGEYAWEVEVRSKTIPMNGQFFHEAPSKNDARGGVGIVTNPESTAYGYIVTSIGYAQGFALYTPELKKVGNYHANTSPWTATNRSDLYRLGMRDGSVAYASAFSDKGAGFWKFDPENPTAAPTNLSAGTNDGTGCISFNGKVTGTGSPTVAFEGSGEGTRVWTFAEDWPTGNSDYKGIVARWDIGNAEQITNGVSAAYGDFIGKTGALFASTIVCITPYADGVFIAQGRGSGNNAKTCPGFIYTDIYGKQLYNSANDVSIIPTCGGSLAITADGSLLAVSGYRGSNIRLYDVTWNGKVPTLKYKGEIENSAVKASNSETSQLAFDPAGNLYSFCRSTNADESGLHCYALAAENPVTTTPAKAKQTLRGSDVNTGIDEIVIEEKEAPVEWYTLQGVRVDGDNLRPGIYVRKQGKLAKKVLIR